MKRRFWCTTKCNGQFGTFSINARSGRMVETKLIYFRGRGCMQCGRHGNGDSMPRPQTIFSHVPRDIMCHPYIITDRYLNQRLNFSLSFTRRSTMAYHQIKLFNPFSLQLGANQDQHRQIQRIIWYAESRFRQALLVCQEAPDPTQKWMQAALSKELVSWSHGFDGNRISDGVTEICINVCRPSCRSRSRNSDPDPG